MSYINLSFLGAPLITVDGVSVEIATRKATALLIYIAVTNQVHSRDTLSTLFWPEYETSRAKASLRRALSDIKKALGNFLQADRQSVRLNEEVSVRVDVTHFRHLLTAPDNNRKTYQQAITLYRADFLTGFTLRDCPDFDEWQFFEQENLRQQLGRALSAVMEICQQEGDFEAAILYGRRYLTLDPLHEPAHTQLMQLYAQDGQQSNAFKQFDSCKTILAEELGIAPSAEAVALHEQIKAGEISPPLSLPRPSVQPEEPKTVLHNLPTPVTSFVGRERELLQIVALLEEPQVRLLTIVGLGGVGKTRLALEVLSTQTNRFADGVWVIDLAPLRTLEEAITAVSQLLNFTFHGTETPLKQLTDFLNDKEMLLLFDNFEHLLDRAEFVSDLLSQTSGVKMIATSREMLDLTEEWLYQMEGLPFPIVGTQSQPADATLALPPGDHDSAAVQLFTQRARQAKFDFSYQTESAHVARICQLVEGLPLALELAAAWVRLLPCHQIALEVEQSLDFLSTSQRNVIDRHRSIRAVFEYSWQMLTSKEQHILAQLSIFRGGFTAVAAEAVAGASLFHLYSLLNKSLLRRKEAGLYELHELLRQFVAEKFAQLEPDTDVVRERHMTYYTNFLHEHEADLFGGEQTAVISRMGQEIENIYKAWLWAADQHHIEALSKSFLAIYQYHAMQSLYQYGESFFSQIISRIEPNSHIAESKTNRLIARLIVYQGEFLYTLGRLTVAEETLRKALSTTKQLMMENEQQLAMQTLGVVLYIKGIYGEAKQLLNEALFLAKKLRNNQRQAYVLMTLGALEQALGNYSQAQQNHTHSLQMFTAMDYQWGIANALRFLGLSAYYKNEFVEAEAHYQNSLDIARKLNFETGVALILNHLGMVAEAKSDTDKAIHFYRQALVSAKDSKARWSEASALHNLGRLTSAHGQKATGWQNLRDALTIAYQSDAVPLVMDILLDMSIYLKESQDHEYADKIAQLVGDHPATRLKTRQKLNQMFPQLDIPKRRLVESTTIQEIVAKITHLG